jgi:hypothetical protein
MTFRWSAMAFEKIGAVSIGGCMKPSMGEANLKRMLTNAKHCDYIVRGTSLFAWRRHRSNAITC